MLQKNEHHSFNGMQQDIAVSKQPASFLTDALNIRMTQREEGNTLLTITNERGTVDTQRVINGTYLGHCLLNQYLVVFSLTQNMYEDCIERFDLSADTIASPVTLFKGNLNFSILHPIEAIGSYENNDVQKVYWTDGYNQPRMMNIIDGFPGDTQSSNLYTNFDFVRTMSLDGQVFVRKILGASGMFPAGVIQYAFTYYDKFGQETNIFYTSPLLYVSYIDRGGSPEDKISNAFRITVSYSNNPDADCNKFDYLRIYSIMRTSINGTPICRRVQDISLSGITDHTVSFTDTGVEGDTVDPTELLYLGGESILAETIEQKDGTLFLGGIKLNRNSLRDITVTIGGIEKTITEVLKNLSITNQTRNLYFTNTDDTAYKYANQLTLYEYRDQQKISAPCGGFKKGETYRFGVQFQHETGKWSDPFFIEDFPCTVRTEIGVDNQNNEWINMAEYLTTIPPEITDALKNRHYLRARGVCVFPEMQDRNIICQGVTCPVLKADKNNYYQSSWFFRPRYSNSGQVNPTKTVSPTYSIQQDVDDTETLHYTSWQITSSVPESNGTPYDPNNVANNIRSVEIQGQYDDDAKFKIYHKLITLHSPDVEFDTDLANIDYSDITTGSQIGYVTVKKTLSDISIQTESPTISRSGSGFDHISFTENDNGDGSHGIVSGLFYDDFIVKDDGTTLCPWGAESSPVRWMVYTWNKSGSLNNDFNRPANEGVRTAVLKKKVISNLRYTDSIYSNDKDIINLSVNNLDLHDSDQNTILKLGNSIYKGNIDTVLTPSNADGMYFSFGASVSLYDEYVTARFTDNIYWKTFSKNSETAEDQGVYLYDTSQNKWNLYGNGVGGTYLDLVIGKEAVRMKYKSSPHLVMEGTAGGGAITSSSGLPIVEITKKVTNRFGGDSDDALQANNWLPCGEPIPLGCQYDTNNEHTLIDTLDGSTIIYFTYGDTYFQRYDCLKTYPFTNEDENQLVEIGSFMLETHVNIDGRYDRNRGQLDNLNMSPINFNLMNPVYSQKDNFFTYRIMDSSFYDNVSFPNQVTWTKEKHAGADVDLWTNITLASTYDLDGSKGKITSLNEWKDTLYCFQDKGISNILFNSRVMVSSSDGTPIEISNNYKLDGSRYLSDGIGCVNKWSIKEAPTGIYFIDSVSNDLYQIGEGINNITLSHNMKTWFREHSIDRTLYDDVNHDVYLIQDGPDSGNPKALCYSELLGQFTSFMSYDNVSLIESYRNKVFCMRSNRLFKMFKGEYNDFFGIYSTENDELVYTPNYKEWYLTFISNSVDDGTMDFDKIFSNIDYRLDFFSYDSENDKDVYEAGVTFDWMQAWDEYQDTRVVDFRDTNSNGLKYFVKGNPQKKFKIWRIQIPRAKIWKAYTEEEREELGTTEEGRYVSTNDRIRNPWCRITLGKYNNADQTHENAEPNNLKAILQDLNVQYYL